MSGKTSKEIVQDIIRLLNGSVLANSVSGEIYHGESRPKNSNKEDIIVIFTAGLNNQIQTGEVTIHIYVPDNVGRNGIYNEAQQRTATIERLAQDWINGLNKQAGYYQFEQAGTIKTVPEIGTNQHFVVVHLRYKLFEG